MIIAAADERLLDRSNQGTNITAITVVNEPALTMQTILQVLPLTTNVVVVIGNSPLDSSGWPRFAATFGHSQIE